MTTKTTTTVVKNGVKTVKTVIRKMPIKQPSPPGAIKLTDSNLKILDGSTLQQIPQIPQGRLSICVYVKIYPL